jgi:hypothetical protein
MKGVDLYVESPDPTDVLDTSDDESERLTRIWRRLTPPRPRRMA